MPSETQLKNMIKDAVAKKKQADAPQETPPASHTKEITETQEQPPKTTPRNSKKTTTLPRHPAIYQSLTTTQNPIKKQSVGIANEAEYNRTFSGRPIRVGVYQSQIYYCVPDVLEISSTAEKQIKYAELKKDSSSNKIISPLVVDMWFFNVNGGSILLNAATAENLNEIIEKLHIPFPEPIDKWLTETSNNIATILAR